MTSKIQVLFPSIPAGSAGVATVTATENGQAVTVDIKGTLYSVHGHLSQVEALKIGDRVLIVPSEEGAVVAGRLRAKGEAPAPLQEEKDGRLLVEAAKSVRLQAGENRIEVHADGRIELHGRQITGEAGERVRLLGSKIELN